MNKVVFEDMQFSFDRVKSFFLRSFCEWATMIPDVNLSLFLEDCCALCSLCGGLVVFCPSLPFVPYSVPLYTSNVLFWGAPFWLCPF